jgi:hypothetical protein
MCNNGTSTRNDVNTKANRVVRNHNVGKENCGVNAVASNGLQGDFGGNKRIGNCLEN